MSPKISRGLGRVAVALACVGTAALAAPTTASAGSAAGLRTTTADQATVQTTTGPLGTFLTDGQGRTLYLFEADTAGTSTCADACAAAWPPLTTTEPPKAGTGVDAGKLTTVARADGSMQVVYDKHPLYLFVKDATPGQTNGQGLNAFGAPWYVVGTDGQPIV